MTSTAIAIIGVAGRFPGARNLSEFWRNLRDGVESVRRLADDELRAAGVTREELSDPDYVKAAAVLDDIAMFDAAFFGFSPRDASIMDPQHRHFLECGWEALEDAGTPPDDFKGAIGVFAGSGLNSYLIHNLLANRRLRETAGLFQLKQTGNDKDVLATRVSYQFNLRGPSINVQTACSSSLVAVHLACQSLLNQECDLALAGGVTIEIPHGHGYRYREGEILSRDGHCRAFDGASSGTVFGSGLGIVVLRRLDEAIAHRDNIRAVILGSAINNDGARKVGYLAPSVEGQAEVITEALAVAGISADDISYVETHGTGTPVGDPIEIRALTRAFQHSSSRSGYCAIGSLKTNVGHLDAAAGVAGLIKTVLSLEHKQLPASLHFQSANPLIEFKDSPVFVNAQLTDWKTGSAPRRAGVTSLGIGGTNAHVVLEEAPASERSRPVIADQLLTISARTETALKQACGQLERYLREHSDLDLADVAFTCQTGRKHFAHRYAIVARDLDEASDNLSNAESKPVVSPENKPKTAGITFLFSGQGSQYVNMGRGLYETEPVFQEALNQCAEILKPHLGFDLCRVLYPSEDEVESSTTKLNETWLTQPALAALEYSLSRWWMSLGIKPETMIGHSIGEYVAACLAGVFSLEDLLEIAAYRGRLIFGLPSGSMLAVPLAAGEVDVNGSLSIAAINHPAQCVVSGHVAAIDTLEAALAKRSLSCRRLHTSHAFHSVMMDPILDAFARHLKRVALHPPRIPYLSNVTGTWIKAEEATDPQYWARHVRDTVRFSDCLNELFRAGNRVLLEVGPGQALTTLARQQTPASTVVYQSLRHPQENVSDSRFALRTLGRMWVSGIPVDWTGLHGSTSSRRVSLPTYPFEHRRFWIDPDPPTGSAVVPAPPVRVASVEVAEDLSDDPIAKWLYRRAWVAAPLPTAPESEGSRWILFTDDEGLGSQVGLELKGRGQDVTLVNPGSAYRQVGAHEYTIRPDNRSDYDLLVSDLFGDSPYRVKIIYLWTAAPANRDTSLDTSLGRGFYGILYLTQALWEHGADTADVTVVSNRIQSVMGEAVVDPTSAVLLGPVRVVPKELPGFRYRAVDLDLEHDDPQYCAARIVDEGSAAPSDAVVAYRHGERFHEMVERLTPKDSGEALKPRLIKGGGYLLTGGLGGIGLTVAEHLAREFRARLVLVGRTALPPEAEWEDCLKRGTVPEAIRDKIRKLLAIRSVGSELLVLKADVTSIDDMREVVTRARKQFGKVDGVFHLGGSIDDGSLVAKTAERAAAVIDAKVRGTLILEEVLRDAPISCFVLFSSVSSFVAPAGQVDYAAANAFLDAFALSRRGPVMAIDWGLWQDVGLGVASPHPLLRQPLAETPEAKSYSSRLSQEQYWLLAEHRLKNGKALIPGTAYLEMAAAALNRGSLSGAVELRDVFFLAPLTFDALEAKEVQVQLKREDDAFRFSILAQQGEWTEHATGAITRSTTRQPAVLDRAAIAKRCAGRAIEFDDQKRTKQEDYFDFGPRWQTLRRLQLGKQECLAELELPKDVAADVSRWCIHPALLDMATGCALYLIDGYENSKSLYLPVSYKRLRSYRQLPAKLYSYIRGGKNTTDQEIAVFDITLLDESGQVLVEVERFQMRRITEPFGSSSLRAQTVAAAPADQVRNPGFGHEGIPSLDGARALVRILQTQEFPLMVVSAQDFQAGTSPTTDISHKVVSTSARANDVEATLAGWWAELLGIESVGLDADFFDLGGHSLIAVRLFGKIKKTYRVGLDLTTLFEARTIRQLAQLIHVRDKTQLPETSVWSPLVAIQPNGSKAPLFLVHAVGPSLLPYKTLANYLGSDQPVYGLQSPLASGGPSTSTRLEDLASIYLEAVRKFLPQGPYLFGGYSLGGLIAFEMSRQLCAKGSIPDRLVLLDTSTTEIRADTPRGHRIARIWQNFQNEGFWYVFNRIRAYWEQFLRNHITEISRGFSAAGKSLPVGLRHIAVEETHKIIMHRYEPQPFPGKIILLRSHDGRRQAKNGNPTLGWSEFARGGVEIVDVPGDHLSILRDRNVSVLASALKSVLPE